MKISAFFNAPLMWRRHVKAQERIALALEDLLSAYLKVNGLENRASTETEEWNDDSALSFASNAGTFDHEQDEKRFAQPQG